MSTGDCQASDTIHRGGTHKVVNTFVHDKWQLRSNVTLDLGLRHELYTPLVGYTPVGGQATYDPATNTIGVGGYGDVPEDLGVKINWKNFAPRTGVSWRLNDQTVVRAGYGVSSLGLPSSYGQDYPIRQIQQITPANTFAPAASRLGTGLPAPAFVPIPASGILDASPLRAETLSVIDPNRTEGTLHSFNVAYQRSLPGGLTAEIAYVGNRGHDILAAYNMNAGHVVGADREGQPLFRQYQRTADTSNPVPVRSAYNSMQVKVDRRMRGGLLLTNSYTLGRAYSFSTGDGGPTISTPADSGAGLAAHHVRLHAQFRQQLCLHVALGARRQVAARRRGREDPWRLAGDRRVFRDLRNTHRLHGERERTARAGQHTNAERQRHT